MFLVFFAVFRNVDFGKKHRAGFIVNVLGFWIPFQPAKNGFQPVYIFLHTQAAASFRNFA